jgi:maleylacetoacetate isomerase
MSRAILYEYWRSSAAYRVRIALNLKGLDYESRPVDLRDGEQRSAEYRALNPQGLVPMLEIDGHRLTQSLAIMSWLEGSLPQPPLLPTDVNDRAHVLALSLVVACDIHPLNNLRVLKYLKNEMGQPQDKIDGWYAHWLTEGLPTLEAMALPRSGRFLFGDSVSWADVCLVPQLYNARRYDVPLEAYPTLLRAEESANELEAFSKARPENQEQAQ